MAVPYYGDFAEDETVYLLFNSFSSDDPSASVTITNLVAADIHIHKNGSTTQKTTANGITVSIDFDGITGNHMVAIDTSNDTGDGGWWVTGSEFSVRMEGTTIDGGTINAWIGSFSIERDGGAIELINALNNLSAAQVNAEVDTALSDYDGPTKAEMDSAFAVTDGKIDVVDGNVDSILVDTGTTLPAEHAVLDGKLDTIDTNVDAVLVDTGTTIPADLATIDANVDAILVDTGTTLPAEHATLDGKLDTIDTVVDAILVDTGTSIPADIAALNDLSAAQVNAEVDTALADYDGPTKAEMDAGFAALNDPSSATIADDVWDEVLTGATHNVPSSAGRRLRTLQEFQGYEHGAVWIDTINGTAGTVDYENGTVENPVDTIADANTIAASVGLVRFVVAPGSSITFAAAQNGQVFQGAGWTLALGGQSIVGSTIIGATVSGIAAGTGTTQYFIDCILNATSHIKGTHLITCGVAGTQTVAEAGDYFLDRCHSAIAGTSTWIWEFGDAIGNTNLSVRNYSGGIQLESMGDTGTDTASIEGQGQVIEGTCTGGTVAIRGCFTVSGITNLTLSDDARYDTTQLSDNAGATPAEVNAEVLDVLNVDTFAEPGDESPVSTTTMQNKLGYLYKFMRNKVETTSSKIHVYDDGESNKDHTSDVSDNGTTFTRGEFSAGDA